MSLENKKQSQTYKDLIYCSNSNSVLSTTPIQATSGNGNDSSIYLSRDKFKIQPTADSTTNFLVNDKDGNALLTVDSSNDYVKTGISQNHVNTLYKEFGLFDFSPTAGYHVPMISNNMMFSDSGDDFAGVSDFGGNGADPVTTLDVSSGTPRIFPASMWYIQDAMTIDSIRVIATCDSSHNLNFHAFSYDLDTSTNHGDLSAGTLLAHIGSVMSATSTSIKTDTLTIDSSSVSANKVVFMFVENESGTGDITCQATIKYHLA